jgi:predicted component of type VI protein secretion system
VQTRNNAVTMRGNARGKAMRERIAQEAARLMAEEGVRDFGLAKRKAAQHLGVLDTQHMPRNAEVERALSEYQRLFQAQTQPAALRRRRELALEVMGFLQRFEPRLVGPVLSGTAVAHSEIELHVFDDCAEALAIFLIEHHIPHQQAEKRLRLHKDQWQFFPSYRFFAGDVGIEIVVFPANGLRQAPLSPVDGKPLRRAAVEAVRQLL